jgi:hypothetical protein
MLVDMAKRAAGENVERPFGLCAVGLAGAGPRARVLAGPAYGLTGTPLSASADCASR